MDVLIIWYTKERRELCAAIDVLTTEPLTKDPESPAAKLIAHPKCVGTPHLGASTVEAQENMSIDVCEQALLILAGELPRSTVNAPIILPAGRRPWSTDSSSGAYFTDTSRPKGITLAVRPISITPQENAESRCYTDHKTF